MDEPLQSTNETTTEFARARLSVGLQFEQLEQRTFHGKKDGGSLSKDAESIPGTKDATKSIKCYAKQEKKGEKEPSTGSDALKKAVVTGL